MIWGAGCGFVTRQRVNRNDRDYFLSEVKGRRFAHACQWNPRGRCGINACGRILDLMEVWWAVQQETDGESASCRVGAANWSQKDIVVKVIKRSLKSCVLSLCDVGLTVV